MPEELITLAVEDSKAREAFARSNQSWQDLERRAIKANAAIGASSVKAGEQMIRSQERNLSVTERHLRQMEREAQLYGKTGAEKVLVQQQQMTVAYGGTTAVLERFNAVVKNKINLETQAAQSATLAAAGARASALANRASALANTEAGASFSGIIAGIKAWHVAVVAAVASALKLPKALLSLVAEMGGYAHGIEQMSMRTGLGAKQVEQLSAMASLAEVDVGVLERTAWKLAEALDDTGEGGKKARQALRDLGVSALDATGGEKALGVVQWEILQRLGAMTDETKRMVVAHALYARSSQELQPMLARWTELEEKVRAGGLAMDESMIKKLAEAEEKLKIFERTWFMLKAKLAEPLTAVIEVITKAIQPGRLRPPEDLWRKRKRSVRRVDGSPRFPKSFRRNIGLRLPALQGWVWRRRSRAKFQNLAGFMAQRLMRKLRGSGRNSIAARPWPKASSGPITPHWRG